jgi:rRNA-processing protein FCF1
MEGDQETQAVIEGNLASPPLAGRAVMTKAKKKLLTLQETLDAAVRLADEDDEMDAILAKSDEELTRELEAEGIDVKAMTARMGASEKGNREELAERAKLGRTARNPTSR